MNNVLFQQTKNDKRLVILYDNDPFNPREEHSNFFTIAGYVKKYSSCYDEIITDDQFMDVVINKHGEIDDTFNRDNLCFPLYVYDHTNVKFSHTPFGCVFDSGMCGYVYVSRETINNEFGNEYTEHEIREKCIEILKNELDMLTKWANGEVYQFELYDANNELIDSCSDFYSQDDIFEELSWND